MKLWLGKLHTRLSGLAASHSYLGPSFRGEVSWSNNFINVRFRLGPSNQLNSTTGLTLCHIATLACAAENHIPINNLIAGMAVIRLFNLRWCQFNSFFYYYFYSAKLWPSPSGKNAESDYNSVMHHVLLSNFYQFLLKVTSLPQGTTVVCSKTPTEPPFFNRKFV